MTQVRPRSAKPRASCSSSNPKITSGPSRRCAR
jgi:hypothetical protein